MRSRIPLFIVVTLLLVLGHEFFAQNQPGKVVYLSYNDARPVIEELSEALPPDLKSAPSAGLAATWANWVTRRDGEIRSRLIQGDEDSLVNFLLFGTSFTRQPRISGRQLILLQKGIGPTPVAPSEEASRLDGILRGRINDLIKGLTAPGNNERLLFARHLIVAQKGHNPASSVGQEQVRKYLLSSLQRVVREQYTYQKALEEARLQGDPSEEFYERSKLYRTRGLSLDTSLLPNFGLEQALKTMKNQGLLKEGSVLRVAIIGPGLDFTDKQEGYDFYPQQTIQPFAIVDSLLRLGISSLSNLAVATFDLSPRVNEHLNRARRRAERGQSYVVQLPRNTQAQWKAEAVDYWEHFGNQIGVSIAPITMPAHLADLKIRAVSIRPSIVSKVLPLDLNIVLQRLEVGPSNQFDLMIATNILVYYDTFEQSLAMANIERMLKPGGFLLTNNVLLELPSSQLRAVDYATVVYSDRPNDGDHVVWYQRKAN